MSNWIKCSRSQRFELGLSFATLNRIFVFEKKQKSSLFILYFSRFALILDKLGCTSEIKMKIFAFHFVFLSVCTNFVKLRTTSDE